MRLLTQAGPAPFYRRGDAAGARTGLAEKFGGLFGEVGDREQLIRAARQLVAVRHSPRFWGFCAAS